ncbi:MAG: VOC family protein [Oscillospiraceae bacterium]
MKEAKIEGVAHVGLFVKDAQRSLEFYRDILGFEVIWDTMNGKVRMVFMQNGGAQIEIVQIPGLGDRPAGSFDHLAMKVTNLEQVKADLEAKGVRFDEGSYECVPCVFENGSKWIFFNGPDGERLEIVENL